MMAASLVAKKAGTRAAPTDEQMAELTDEKMVG